MIVWNLEIKMLNTKSNCLQARVKIVSEQGVYFVVEPLTFAISGWMNLLVFKHFPSPLGKPHYG